MDYKKLLLIFLICFPLNTGAHIDIVRELPSHPTYFGFYFQKFSHWFNENIFNWLKRAPMLSSTNGYHHWYADPKDQKIYNILWGIGWNPEKNNIFYTLQIYSATNMKISHFRSDEEEICQETNEFLKCNKIETPIVHTGQPTLRTFPLTHQDKFIFESFVKRRKIYGSLERPRAVFFDLADSQAEWLPDPLKKIVYRIGYATRLPLDKVEINNKGEIIVYYP